MTVLLTSFEGGLCSHSGGGGEGGGEDAGEGWGDGGGGGSVSVDLLAVSRTSRPASFTN